jgi:hypothetical protein
VIGAQRIAWRAAATSGAGAWVRSTAPRSSTSGRVVNPGGGDRSHAAPAAVSAVQASSSARARHIAALWLDAWAHSRDSRSSTTTPSTPASASAHAVARPAKPPPTMA